MQCFVGNTVWNLRPRAVWRDSRAHEHRLLMPRMPPSGHLAAIIRHAAKVRLRPPSRNSDPVAADGDDRLTEFMFTVPPENLSHRLDPALNRNIGKPDDPRMYRAPDKDQGRKIRINCDQDAPFFDRKPQ